MESPMNIIHQNIHYPNRYPNAKISVRNKI